MIREFAKYSIPSVLGMVASSLYTIVDGIFVGRGVGATALGSINIVFPFIMLQIAISMLISVGGANIFSSSMGKGDKEYAKSAFSISITTLTILSVIINLFALIFPESVCNLLGADSELLPMSVEYLRYIALFGIIYMPGLGISIFIRNDGVPGLEMIGTICGALTNIVLDAVFIFVFGWGVAGAAIATGIGQIVSVAIYMSFFLRKQHNLSFKIKKVDFTIIKKIFHGGFPSFLMEFSQSAITLSFNLALMKHIGVSGVGAYSIVMYICSIANMMLIGIVQGAQPLLSFNHGKRDEEKLRSIYKIATITNIIIAIIFYTLTILFGNNLASIFIKDEPTITGMAAEMMKIYFLGFFPIGLSLINVLYMQTTERENKAIIISFLRCIGFVQIFLLILPPYFGLNGICLSLLFGELINSIISFILLNTSKPYKKLSSEIIQ